MRNSKYFGKEGWGATIYTVSRIHLASMDMADFNSQHSTLMANYTGVFMTVFIVDEATRISHWFIS